MVALDEKKRQANRERQQKYRELHREEINQTRRDRYNDRISNGLCPRCGNKAKKGYTLCEGCCDYQADLNKKYIQERKDAAPKTASAKPKTAAAPKAKAPAKPKAAPKAKAAVKPKAAPKAKAAAKPKPAAKAKPAARSKTKK